VSLFEKRLVKRIGGKHYNNLKSSLELSWGPVGKEGKEGE
jgi:hypothetical protein